MFRKGMILILCCAALLAKGGEIQWSKDNDFQPWKACWRLKCQRSNDLLKLTDIGKDSSIIAQGVTVDPAKYDRISIRYRAVGVPQKTTGQLYFAGGSRPRFSDSRKWDLPSLQSDGKWHTMILDLDKNMRKPEAWSSHGTVTQLRLDMTDQVGGVIEIESITFSKIPQITEVKWDKSNDFQPWQACWRLKCQRSNGILKLTDIGKDSSIIARNLKLKNNGFNKVDIRYRAVGTPKYTRGQLYFSNNAGRFSDAAMIALPSLINDGKWHIMSVDIAKNARNFEQWQKTLIFKDLRLDMMDQSGGEIEIEYIRLYKVTDSDPEEAAWVKITPQFLPSPVPEQPYFSGKMIRFPGKFNASAPKHFFFRKKFTLTELPKRAILQFLADDAAEIFINGKAAASCDTWRKATIADVSKFLKPGENLLAVNHWNHHGSTGMLLELYCEFADGSFIRINSDKTFVSSEAVLAGWNSNMSYDDSAWRNALEQPVPPGGPWITRIPYIDFRLPPQKFETFSTDKKQLTAGSDFKGRVVFNGKKPDKLPSFDLVISSISGSRIMLETVDKYDFKTIGDNRWELTFSVPLPRYIVSQKLHLALHFISGLSLDKTPEMQIDFINSSPLQPAPRSKVVATPAGPQLEINGKVDFTFAALAAIKNPKIPAGQDYTHAPIRVIEVERLWVGIDKFDFQGLDKNAENELRRYPDAKLIVQIACYPPRDWGLANPDELAVESTGKFFHDTAHWMLQSNRVALSFASEKGRRELEKMVEATVKYVEKSHWRHRVVGYRIAGGHTSEWIAWGHDRKLFFDYSPVNRAAFKKYLQKNHPDIRNFDIPTPAERLARKGDEALLDPELHRRAIAYNYFESECVADMIISLCRAAKQACGNRVVIGTYYGYHMNVSATDFQFTGHLALKKLLDSKAVDFIMSPPSYAFRQVGDTMGDMKPFQSIANHNIMPVIEDDTRTHNTADYCRYYQALNPAQSVALLQRNMAMMLCRNQIVLLYALMRGTELHFPELSAPAKAIQQTGKHCVTSGVARNAEIALVVSENALKHMPLERRRFHTRRVQVYEQGTPRKTYEGLTRLGGTLIAGSVPTSSRIGAPVDYILAEDLKDNPGNYKLYIFLNAFCSDPEFLKAVEKLRERKCVLAWFYAPGYISGQKYGTEYMKQLTGFEFGKSDSPLMMKFDLPGNESVGCGNQPVTPVFFVKPAPGTGILANYHNSGLAGFAEKRNGKATDIYIGSWHLPVALGKYLAEKAGVHTYIDSADPVEANEKLFTLHARYAGKKVISLPEATDVLDVFNKKIIARKARQFTIDAPLHSTWLFYFGDDAEKLLQKLEAE